MEACPFDLCVFVLREDAVVPDGDEQISRTKPSQGNIVGVHVDEGICGGGSKFQEVLKKLEAKFSFGSKKSSSFTFTGIDVTQHSDSSITLSQSNYVGKYHQFQLKTPVNFKPIYQSPKASEDS